MAFNLFKSAKKVVNQNLMEAIVAGCVLVAAADGEIEDKEMKKLDKLLTTNDNLSGFKPAEIRKVMTRFQNMLDADFDVGRNKVEKELVDISDNEEHCEEVFLNMLAIAKSDGEIEDKEKVVLVKVGRLLGISLADYGLA